MAKRIAQNVDVMLRQRDGGGTEPAAFSWAARRYRVLSVDAIWKETGRWWDGEGERTTFRVTAALERLRRRPLQGEDTPAPGVYDLCYRTQTGDWLLAEIQD